MNRRLRNVVGLALAALVGATLTVALPAGANGDDDDGDFLRAGTARNARDPENPANEVIKIDTTSPAPECNPALAQNCQFGIVSRRLNDKIAALDNQVELKAYFQPPRVGCGGGSPRMTLEIDLDGNGQTNGNAHGNYGPGPFGTGCPPPGVWHYEDLTDMAPRWDVTQLIGPGELALPPGQNPFLVPWDLLETLVSGFANHNVCTGGLHDDSGWFPPAEGIAFYDVISIGDETWTERDDTAGRGFASGCKKKDKDDD
jgi:hypothetical protein